MSIKFIAGRSVIEGVWICSFYITDRNKLIDFAHVFSAFLEHNDKVLKRKSTMQQKKFNNLLKDKKPQNDPENIIFNYSSCFIKSGSVFF